MRLVFASNNAHKLDEVRAIMPSGIEVLSLREIGFEQEIEENGATLEENSRIKAETVWEYVKGTMDNGQRTMDIDGVFADDTGLEIDALDGRPGVYTARWYLDNGHGTMDNGHGTKDLGEKEIFAANRAKALRELAGKTNRGAQFKTVVTLILKKSEDRLQHSDLQVKGVVRGHIATEERGQGGFGYDPLFIPEGYEHTFAELPIEVKNSISHRARAMEALVQTLHEIA
jgi:XTP/dITP diphosphohydrolase